MCSDLQSHTKESLNEVNWMQISIKKINEVRTDETNVDLFHFDLCPHYQFKLAL